MTNANAFDRRAFLRTGLIAGGGATALGGLGGLGGLSAAAAQARTSPAPALLRARPAITHGVQTGEVTSRSALVWARADRPARMLVDVATRPDFRGAATLRGPVLTPDTDLTGKTRLRGLPAGHDVHYRVRLEGLDGHLLSAPATGRFRTAPTGRRDIRFVWSGDLAGQGWGINEDFGGFRIFRAMGSLKPDFFLCSGDWIYADGPLKESVTLPDGTIWRNVTIEEKAKVAETLAEYRGQFRYNLMDAALRDFNARVPMVYQWDDHEVTNNWYPGEILNDSRYTEQRADVLAARSRQAAYEYLPMTPAHKDDALYRKVSYGPLLDVFVLDMRTRKNANDANTAADATTGVLGAEQTEWLKRELRRSTATWKVIANDLPIGLIVPDGTAQEGIAQGDGGAPLGREREIAGILSHAKRHRIRNMVWLTADVHYTAAHYYDPEKAAFKDFDPFWEFVSGPLNAGGFGPNPLEGTFGPQLRFHKAGSRANSSPAEGAQFFGEVAIDGRSGVLTVRLRDLDNTVLYSVDLDPLR